MVNELAFYLCLVLILIFSFADLSKEMFVTLGWVLIGIVIVLCSYNVLVIAIFTMRHIKLFLFRLRVNLVKNNFKSAVLKGP